MGGSPDLMDILPAACVSAPKYPGAAHKRIRFPFARAVSPDVWLQTLLFFRAIPESAYIHTTVGKRSFTFVSTQNTGLITLLE